jgi:ERCC4-type nuclease
LAIQRKTYPDDLLASLDDGRLAREMALLTRTEYPVLLLEGQPSWTSDGHLMRTHGSRWTRAQLRNLTRSVALVHGVAVEHTADITDTVSAIQEFEAWFRKDVHRSLLARSKRTYRDSWGTSDKRDFARFFLQGLPGVGSVLAEAMYDHFEKVPVSWGCTFDELKAVPGIGDKRAKALWETLQ